MQTVKFIAKLGVSLILIAYLVNRLDLHETWQSLYKINPFGLLPVLALGVGGIIISAWKWAQILRHLGVAVSFVHAIRLFWIGVFFNNFLPGRTGGDLVRAYTLAKHAQNSFSATVSVIIDRGLNLIALISIGLIAFLLAGAPVALQLDLLRFQMLIGTGLCIVALGGAFVLLRSRMPIVQNLLGKIISAGRILWRAPAQVFHFLVLACLYQLSMIIAHFAVAHLLRIEIAFLHFFYLIPLTALVTLLPISFNGVGVREGAFAFALSRAGTTVELAVALSLTITLCTLFLSLVGGYFYAIGLSPDGPITRSQIQREAESCP